VAKKIILVWDYHGSGRLVGVFDDRRALQRLEQLVRETRQEGYVRFTEVRLNEVVSTSFGDHPGTSR
jgi:hypothetical protein